MRREPEAVRITSAGRSHQEDVAGRQRRYLVSMIIRTLCFVAAGFSMGHWYLWVFLAGSLVLPYVAVVLANVGGPTQSAGPQPFGADLDRPALEGPREPHDRRR